MIIQTKSLADMSVENIVKYTAGDPPNSGFSDINENGKVAYEVDSGNNIALMLQVKSTGWL